jgi:hypothetical protein
MSGPTIECAFIASIGTEPELKVSQAGKPWTSLSACSAVRQEDRADVAHRLVRGGGRQAEGEPQFQPRVVFVGLAARRPAGHCLRAELKEADEGLHP